MRRHFALSFLLAGVGLTTEALILVLTATSKLTKRLEFLLLNWATSNLKSQEGEGEATNLMAKSAEEAATPEDKAPAKTTTTMANEAISRAMCISLLLRETSPWKSVEVLPVSCKRFVV